MLVGRNQETAYFNEYMKKQDSQMVVFYGQKFMGKTSFLLDFCKDRAYSYFLVHALSKDLMMGRLSEAIRALDDYETDEKKILIIDEFQGFAKNEEFMNILLSCMETHKVLVVLVSSEVNWVETSMVKAFGRSVASIHSFLKCRELSFQNICRLFPDYKRTNLFIMYSILGGVPGMWNFFDPELSVEENIIQNILSEKSFLRLSGYSYNMAGLRESGVYDTILMCMADGNTKLNDLYRLTGFSRAKISVYLKTLMEQEQIDKIYSIDCVGYENSQKGVYDISNHFTAFWFRFIYPHEHMLCQMDEEAFFREYIQKNLLDYCGKYIRKVVKEYFVMQGAFDSVKKNSPDIFLGKKNQIPLVFKDDKTYHAVLCHYLKIMMTYDDFLNLVRACDEAKLRERDYYIVSFRDFDEKITLEARMKDNIHLLSFITILESF